MRDQQENTTGQHGCGCGGSDGGADAGAATARPTVVVSLAARAHAEPDPAIAEILRALTARGAAFEAVADLAALAARKDPALPQWAAAADLRIVGLPRRAVKWLFHAAGAELPQNATVIDLAPEADESPTPAEVVGQLLASGTDCGGTEAPCECSGAAEATTAATEPDAWVPWFPVIDYDRCTGCRQCANFCLFGVFEVDDDDGRVTVANPQACKTNCPACARMCPKGAIIFPYYPAAPINGREPAGGTDPQAPAADLKEALRGDIYSVLRARGSGASAGGVGMGLDGRKATPADLARLAEQAQIPPQVLMSLGVSPAVSGERSACSCECECSAEGKTRPFDGKTSPGDTKTCGCECDTGVCACGNECETDGGTCGCECAASGDECETEAGRQGRDAAGCGCHDKSDPQAGGN